MWVQLYLITSCSHTLRAHDFMFLQSLKLAIVFDVLAPK